MNHESIKFSILMPVYNVQDFVRESIQSVLNQSYKNYELIIVDDGSTDDSGKICDTFGKNFTNIRVFHKTNGGLIHTRRYAIYQATGDYYLHLDSDDLIEPNTLEVLHKTISKYHCDCVFFNRKTLRNLKLCKPEKHIREGFCNNERELLKRVLVENPYNALVLKCAKAELYSNMDYSPYYHLRHGEDLLQTLEILEKCKSAAFIDDDLYIYRIRNGSITHSGNLYEEQDFTIRKKTLDFIRKKAVFTKKDMSMYRLKCAKIFTNQVIEVGTSLISNEKKKRIFAQMRNDDYFVNFLNVRVGWISGIGKKAVVFYLFNLKWDNLNLIFLNLLYRRR